MSEKEVKLGYDCIVCGVKLIEVKRAIPHTSRYGRGPNQYVHHRYCPRCGLLYKGRGVWEREVE